MVRVLDFYPGGPGSNPIWDAGFFSSYASSLEKEPPSGTWDFFQAMHHLLVTNFHIRKTDRSKAILLWWFFLFYVLVFKIFVLLAPYECSHTFS